MKKLLYIPSYEDPAGTDPVTPAVSFAGGVISKNHTPVAIDWDTFPSIVYLYLPQCWFSDAGVSFDGTKSALTISKAEPGVYGSLPPNAINGEGLGLQLVYFKNGYLGWKFGMGIKGSDSYGWSRIKLFGGRAYDITSQLEISPFGRYCLTENYSNAALGAICHVAPPYEILDHDPFVVPLP